MKYFLLALIFVQINYAQAVPQYDQKLAFPFHFETNQYTGNKVTVTSQAELLSALSFLDNTDIIELADGNYGRLNIANINPTSELIIKSEHNRGAVFSNIEFLNSSNITLEGVRVDMDLEEFYGVEVRDSSGIKIKHSYIYAPDFNSGKNLFLTNVSNFLLVDSEISSTTDGVHTIGTLQDVTFKNNKIEVRFEAIPSGAHADVFQFRSTYIDNLNIIGNELSYAHQNIFLQSIGDGPWSNINIINNISLQKGVGGFSGKHVYVDSVTNLKIEGNTFATVTADQSVDYSWGIYALNGVGDFSVLNNIFYNALYMTVAPATDYNLFYNATSKKTIGNYSTLEAFQLANPTLEINSVESDPLFNDLLNEDLRLLPGSPAIDVGSNQFDVLGELDIYGHPRKISDYVDIGAIEFLK